MFHRAKKIAAGVAALAALALGGAAIADATSSSSSGSTSSTGAPAAPPVGKWRPPAFRGPAPGTAAHEDAEKPVSGDAAAKAQAAAVKAVGSGTAGDVTTDYRGGGYETTVTKADGSKVEIHLDSSFRVMQRPGGPGSPGGPPPGARGSGAAGGPPPGAPRSSAPSGAPPAPTTAG